MNFELTFEAYKSYHVSLEIKYVLVKASLFNYSMYVVVYKV